MARGPKKHLKRVFAPKHWLLDKLAGVWAPRPSTGPHKLRECMPLIVLLRNRLKYALTYNEVKMIVMQRLIKVDGKVRTDMTYPAGFMDVITIEKTKENFRLLFDTKGRFAIHKIHPDEAAYKLCRVKKVYMGSKGVPYANTHDGRTIRYPDPEIKENDSVRIDIQTGKVLDFLKFEIGATVMMTGGNNIGRVGVITHRERHPGNFEIIHVRDAAGNNFATRLSNVFVIGHEGKPWVSLPKGDGIQLSNVDDRHMRMKKNRIAGQQTRK
ncbi:40S ribosomal protein S4, X isoform [Perkinsus olseni]|uniref:40S ribosomal protein S4 n=3 Tax=Perkinsus olseni TaxID=32597 RepID=A0A7J6NZY2_PEROL|nr:40S ribosomal protein S4, X isoform [Perkinsus olseni]